MSVVLTYFLQVDNHPLRAPHTTLVSETSEDPPVSGLTLAGDEEEADRERESLAGVGQNDKELGEHVEPRDRAVRSVTIPAGGVPHHPIMYFGQRFELNRLRFN